MIPPATIPLIAPYLFERFQNNAKSITGPNVAPKPAQANDTIWNDDLLDCGGKQKLDGKQALSYSRIRYVGNADFERASRQRTVMTQVLKKAAVNPVAMARIFVTALPELSTNLSVGKSYGYTLRAPFLLIGYQLKTQQIPADDTFYGDDVDGESVLRVDCDANDCLWMR